MFWTNFTPPPPATGNAVLVAGSTPADALAEVARDEGLVVESQASAPQGDPNGQPADAERLLDLAQEPRAISHRLRECNRSFGHAATLGLSDSGLTTKRWR